MLLGSLASTVKKDVATGGLVSTSGGVASATDTFVSASGIFVPSGKPKPGKALGVITLKKEPGTGKPLMTPTDEGTAVGENLMKGEILNQVLP